MRGLDTAAWWCRVSALTATILDNRSPSQILGEVECKLVLLFGESGTIHSRRSGSHARPDTVLIRATQSGR